MTEIIAWYIGWYLAAGVVALWLLVLALPIDREKWRTIIGPKRDPMNTPFEEDDNNYPRMSALARTFPSLARITGGAGNAAPGVAPFDALELHTWVTTSGARTSGNYHAVAFVLNVFNGPEWGEKMPFDVVQAFAVWDRPHREAFLAWARDPWFA